MFDDSGTKYVRVMESKFLPWLWLVILAVLALYTWRWWSIHPMTVDSDLLALLPEEQVPATAQQAQVRLIAAAERRVIVLVGGGDLPAAIRAADAYYGALAQKEPAVGRIRYVVDATAQAGWRAFFTPYRYVLLPETLRAQLRDGNGALAVQQALQWYYSPVGLPGRLAPTEDPFQFFSQWQLERVGGSRLRVMQDRLVAGEGDRHYVALILEIPGSAFESGTQRRVVPALTNARAAAEQAVPGVTVTIAGIVLHAAEATDRAQREIWLIGLGSLVGIALLTLLAFRSPYLLLLAQVPILVGCLAAFALCSLLFGRLHAVTLVFGTTLLGVAVDYSFHYLCHTSREDTSAQRLAHLRSLVPGMGLAWITTVLAYLALAVPPFPVLRQMAVFSMSGLLFAWLTVLCWLPRLTRGGAQRDAGLVRTLAAMRHRWPRVRPDRATAAVTVVALAGITLGVLQVQVNDDIRLLQNSPQALLAEYQRALMLVGLPNPAQFLLVEAETPEGVLRAEEALREALDRFRERGVITGYQALSQWVPSVARQRADSTLLVRQVYARGGWLDQLGGHLGVSASWLEAARKARRAAGTNTIDLEAWLHSPASEPFRPQWLGRTEHGYASIILLHGIQGRAGVDALSALARQAPGVVWVDRVENISRLLGIYRREISGVIGLGYLLVLTALIARYRRAAWRVIAPTFIASLTVLGLFGWIGFTVNLFTALALLLVLGMGVDYGIYLHEEREDHTGAWLGVCLAALSTLMSFGFLAFSRTPALHIFGLTMLCGVGVAWLLAPSFSAR